MLRSLLLVSLPLFVCHCLLVWLVLLWVLRNSLQKREWGGSLQDMNQRIAQSPGNLQTPPPRSSQLLQRSTSSAGFPSTPTPSPLPLTSTSDPKRNPLLDEAAKKSLQADLEKAKGKLKEDKSAAKAAVKSLKAGLSKDGKTVQKADGRGKGRGRGRGRNSKAVKKEDEEKVEEKEDEKQDEENNEDDGSEEIQILQDAVDEIQNVEDELEGEESDTDSLDASTLALGEERTSKKKRAEPKSKAKAKAKARSTKKRVPRSRR